MENKKYIILSAYIEAYRKLLRKNITNYDDYKKEVELGIIYYTNELTREIMKIDDKED